ncbi:UrcA family protein [Rhizomicrobium palustre]|uniref:UrcA family protein n=1 Tax=Rhizomicrobium palustre TaxID=189966 RepID=A0A846N1W0_9PROT|nr:UrcA family protein [Rhizomicrobium palustre]NIK89465.1 UrcA family protein [Rhizomicrobium palustre]
MTRFASIAAGFAFAAVLMAGSAFAESVRVEAAAPLPSGLYQTRAAMVPYQAGELASDDGARAVYARIEASTHAVCGENLAQQPSEAMTHKYAACRARAMAGAVKDLDSPRLTAIAH